MNFPRASMPRLAFVTMGCAKNEVDSDLMKARLQAAGYEICDASDKANGVIVNTCSFIESATEESLEVIFDYLNDNQMRHEETELIIAGCMPSRYGTDLQNELPEVKSFIPCARESDIVAICDEIFAIERAKSMQPVEDYGIESFKRYSSGPSSYVKISDGCDRFCSYCTIPFIRGGYRSFPPNQITQEISNLVNQGSQEIVLIAQDTGRWGRDMQPPQTLACLLDDLARSFPSIWFRVMYLQPEGITDELLTTMSSHDNICSYFDIPLQHCNSEILSDMNRKGSKQEYLEMLAHIRRALPDVTLRTTVIVGFPGETEEHFDELCDFIEEANFDYVGVFAYSPEEGTAAATLPNQVSQEDKIRRAQIIRDLADGIGATKTAQNIGRTMWVLIEAQEDDGQYVGRTQGQAPEVDGVVYVNQGNIGQKALVCIEDTFLYDMEAL